MNIAEDLGIETPPNGLLRFQDGRFCYIVKRFDRLKDGDKLHQEDFQPEAEEMSLSINGKRNSLKREDFIALARYMGLADRAVTAIFDKMENKKDSIKAQVETSFLPQEMKATFLEIFAERWSRLCSSI